jgi:hypothetical protein
LSACALVIVARLVTGFNEATIRNRRFGNARGEAAACTELIPIPRGVLVATLPGQLGEWCEHANACLTCKFYRADSGDIEHFRCERRNLYSAIEALEEEARAYEDRGQMRMAEITRKRITRNKDAVQNTDIIVRSIETEGCYQGNEQRYKPAPPIQGVLL